jgi:ABC-type antimicrobial peptide transport system permease subunit
MTYAVARRTGEIGLRVSLGAEQHQVARMVIFDALRVVGLGVIVGLPAALACARLIRGQLHGVQWADPGAISVALVTMGISAVLAVLVPAVRAARVSPLTALRQE